MEAQPTVGASKREHEENLLIMKDFSLCDFVALCETSLFTNVSKYELTLDFTLRSGEKSKVFQYVFQYEVNVDALVKSPKSPFDKLRAKGGLVEIIDFIPFA